MSGFGASVLSFLDNTRYLYIPAYMLNKWHGGLAGLNAFLPWHERQMLKQLC